MKIAAAYIRVSTDEQTELSPDSQIKQIREYAKAHDYIVTDEYIFRDDGISGRTTAKRPEFNKMIATAKQKPTPFEAVLLWKFSRFARNREDSIVYKSMLKRLGIDVISISEPIGDDKMSIIIEAMLEAMDEYYSINLSEEVSRGMLEGLSRGRIMNSAPLGYVIRDKKLIIDETTAPIIRRIYSEFLSGKNMLPIARELNGEGIRTLNNKPFETRTIEYILRNPLYKGCLRYTPGKGSQSHYHSGKETLVFKGNHEPIIPPEIWEKVAQRMNAIKATHKKYCPETPRKYDLMLRGLLKCSACGSTLIYSKKGYQCGLYNKGKCNTSHYISENKINEAVVDALRTLDVNTVTIRPRNFQAPELSENIVKQLQRENAKLKRIKEAYQAGIDTIDEYKANKEKITAEIEKLKAKQRKKSQQPLKKVAEAKKIEFIKLFDSGEYGPAQLNSVLRSFVDKIVYDKSREAITLYLYA